MESTTIKLKILDNCNKFKIMIIINIKIKILMIINFQMNKYSKMIIL